MKACLTTECDDTLPDNSKHDLCKNCRQSIFSYWRKRPPSAVMKRRSNLKKFNSRMEIVYESLPDRIKSKYEEKTEVDRRVARKAPRNHGTTSEAHGRR